MRALWKMLLSLTMGALLISATAGAQKPPSAAAPKAPPAQKAPLPAANPAPPQSTAAQQSRNRVIFVEPVRVFDPFFDYPYPYTYEPEYMAENFGYVKIKTDRKDANVYVDGGFADKIEKAKKFALRPGNHDIELRDSDGRVLFRQRIAVLVGKTTELRVG